MHAARELEREGPGGGPGRLYVVAAPSGAGKTSLVKALMEREPKLRFSVSYTTRKPRVNEIDGRDYHFISQAQFEKWSANDEFLEHARVFDNFYGTGVWRSAARRSRPARCCCSKSTGRARARFASGFPRRAAFSFCRRRAARSKQRLRARSTDTEAVIRRRLQDARLTSRIGRISTSSSINDRFEQASRICRPSSQERGEALAATRPEVARLAADLLAP